jgi:hypothetical protein
VGIALMVFFSARDLILLAGGLFAARLPVEPLGAGRGLPRFGED